MIANKYLYFHAIAGALLDPFMSPSKISVCPTKNITDKSSIYLTELVCKKV